ncbi:hypothetical protein C0J52_22211 [Blattella germanica]|nr:hypothetical protein C0J52_22211 [Blattella germanica]
MKTLLRISCLLLVLLGLANADDYECYRNVCLGQQSNGSLCFCVGICSAASDCSEDICIDECYEPKVAHDVVDYFVDVLFGGKDPLTATTKEGLNITDLLKEMDD